jgi:hypothetical protein
MLFNRAWQAMRLAMSPLGYFRHRDAAWNTSLIRPHWERRTIVSCAIRVAKVNVPCNPPNP